MRRMIQMISVLLLPAWAIANSGPYPYSQRDALGKVTVEGCLYASDGNFNLVDDRGYTVELKGKSGTLDTLVGQRVRLRGEPVAVAKPGSMSASMSENVTTMRVSHVEHTSGGSCEKSGVLQ